VEITPLSSSTDKSYCPQEYIFKASKNIFVIAVSSLDISMFQHFQSALTQIIGKALNAA
jgi:hypothetical protein